MSDPPAETATMTQRSPAGNPATVSLISAPVGAACSCASPCTPVARSKARNVGIDGPRPTAASTATAAPAAATAAPARQRRPAGCLLPVPVLPRLTNPGSPAGRLPPGKLAEHAADRDELVVVRPAAAARLKVPDHPGTGAVVERANQVGADVPAPPGA